MLRVAPAPDPQRAVRSEDNVMVGPFPKKALQNVLSYLPSALEQWPLRRVDKQWCSLTTDSIKAKTTMPVADVREYLVFFKSRLNTSYHQEEIEALDQTLEQRQEAQPLFGPRWHIPVIEDLLKIHPTTEDIYLAIEAPDSEFSMMYFQRCRVYEMIKTVKFKSAKTHLDYQNFTICVMELTRMRYISIALLVIELWDNIEHNSSIQKQEHYESFNLINKKISDLMVFNGDLKGAHSFLNEIKSSELRKARFKEFYKTLISHNLKTTAIELTLAKNFTFYPLTMPSNLGDDGFWIMHQVRPLVEVFIESGKLKESYDFAYSAGVVDTLEKTAPKIVH